MKISVLDYGVIDQNETAKTALHHTVRLAQKAESLGFHRFWIAEHHHIFAFASTSPELLMMHLADHTTSIRIGSGGIMALHYSPYKVMENLHTLAAFHPGRIDVGLGNYLGTRVVQQNLKSHFRKDEYPKVVESLVRLNYQQSHIMVLPECEECLPFFVLSHSKETAKLAGELDLGFVFGIFPYMPFSLEETMKETLPVYRQACTVRKPYVIFACFVIIADTPEEVEDYARCLDVWMLGNKDFNEFHTYPSIEQAKAYRPTDSQLSKMLLQRERVIMGTPLEVKAQLDYWSQLGQVDEILAIPLVPTIEARMRSLELLHEILMEERKEHA